MADHISKQVRDRFEELLKNIADFNPSPGVFRIYPGRVYQLSREELPACLIFTEDERIEKATRQHRQQGAIQKRFIETVVYTFARSQDRILDSLDDLAKKVEQEIFKDSTLGGIVAETFANERTNLIGGEPDSPTGASRLSFVSMALTQEGHPDKALQQQNGGIFS